MNDVIGVFPLTYHVYDESERYWLSLSESRSLNLGDEVVGPGSEVVPLGGILKRKHIHRNQVEKRPRRHHLYPVLQIGRPPNLELHVSLDVD